MDEKSEIEEALADAKAIVLSSVQRVTSCGPLDDQASRLLVSQLEIHWANISRIIRSAALDRKEMASLAASISYLIVTTFWLGEHDPRRKVAWVEELNRQIRQSERNLSIVGNRAKREKNAAFRTTVQECARRIHTRNRKWTANAIATSAEMKDALASAHDELRAQGKDRPLPKPSTVYGWVQKVLEPGGAKKKGSETGRS
ncbi:hypothetical protein [Alsobacter sp. R-9]